MCLFETSNTFTGDVGFSYKQLEIIRRCQKVQDVHSHLLHIVPRVFVLYASSPSSSSELVWVLSLKPHGSYLQTPACEQIVGCINRDLKYRQSSDCCLHFKPDTFPHNSWTNSVPNKNKVPKQFWLFLCPLLLSLQIAICNVLMYS